MRILMSLVLGALLMAVPACAETPPAADPANTLVLELTTGKVQIKLRPDLAPGHVARVKELAKEGFYNGLVFHRVIEGFMAQTGDRTGTGAGGSELGNLPAEFTPTQFERGTVAAARTEDFDSADSQFFICFTHTPHLNGKYTVWGQVVDGMMHVDNVKNGDGDNVAVSTPDKMVEVSVLADAPK